MDDAFPLVATLSADSQANPFFAIHRKPSSSNEENFVPHGTTNMCEMNIIVIEVQHTELSILQNTEENRRRKMEGVWGYS